MKKFNQNLIKVEVALLLAIIFIRPFTDLYVLIFGHGIGGGIFSIGPEIPQWVDGFSYSFPFFLTLIEFFSKRSFLDRRPYLYIVGFFVFLSFVDEKFLLAMAVLLILGVIPGTLYHWIKDKKVTPSKQQ